MKEKLLYITNKMRMHNLGGKPRYYVIHETQNFSADAVAERNNLEFNDGYPSFHSVVDNLQVVRCIPFNMGAWHTGDGNGNGNMYGIGLEICSSTLATHFDETFSNAVKVTATDLGLLGLTVNDLRQHNDFSGKDCPKYIRNNGLWQEFKRRVQEEMNKTKTQEQPKKKTDFEVAREWAMKEKLTDGSRPKDALTREEFWAILFRFNNKFLK